MAHSSLAKSHHDISSETSYGAERVTDLLHSHGNATMPCGVLVNPPLLKDNQSSDIFHRKRSYWWIFLWGWLLLRILLANPVYPITRQAF